jgi:uncharacterized Zn finger protein
MTVEEKAERLLLDGAVTILSVPMSDALSAVVHGDHDVYSVYRETDRWRCTCPARKKCSHIEAVERVT